MVAAGLNVKPFGVSVATFPGGNDLACFIPSVHRALRSVAKAHVVSFCPMYSGEAPNRSRPAMILLGNAMAKVYDPSNFLMMVAAFFCGLGSSSFAISSVSEVFEGGNRCPSKASA